MMKNRILILLSLSVILAAIIALSLVYSVFGRTISPKEQRAVIFIPTGASVDQVFDSVLNKLDVKKPNILRKIANLKKYPSHIKPGRYLVEHNYSCNGLINLLRSGGQAPVKLTFNNIRTIEQLAGKIGKQIEADSASIVTFLMDDSNYYSDGFTRETIIGLFIPNTYEIYWNYDAKKFYDRMLREYKLFWNGTRMSLAQEKNLTPNEVSILASIIDDEVAKNDEKPRIAGVYLNRLRLGMPLQACPTIKFAMNDFTITRVLKKHLDIESPYNTYKHKGFPPGPIGCPTISGIDAVLYAEKHDYLFFAARADFSGYHNFSRTLSEHNRYAAVYQNELNKRKIFK